MVLGTTGTGGDSPAPVVRPASIELRGPPEPLAAWRASMRTAVRTERMAPGAAAPLERVTFADGARVECRAVEQAATSVSPDTAGEAKRRRAEEHTVADAAAYVLYAPDVRGKLCVTR